MADQSYAGNIIETIPYSQKELETEIKKILLDKGLVDILYPGSNVSQLADVMTYLIHVLNTNTAMNLQEVLLPLATKRMNILWGARQLGYEPKQKISYIYVLKIIAKKNPNFGMNPGDSGYEETFTYQIPKYTEFTSESHSYWYLGEIRSVSTSNKLIDDLDESAIIYIPIKEGQLTRFEDNELLRQRAFNVIDDEGEVTVKKNYLVPFSDVEENGLEVFLTYIDENNVDHFREKWEKSESFLIDPNFSVNDKKYVRIQNIFLDMPEIYFEVGNIGPGIRLNTLIEINVLQSSGKDGTAGESFKFADNELDEKFVINTFKEYQEGQDAEKSLSIKENAPLYNSSANRLVTARDYVSMTQRHEKVKYATCWGSEDETARDIGIAYLAMTPERTVREFMSVYDRENDGDPTNDNEYNPNNEFFHLQLVPRHPYGGVHQGIWDMGSDDDNGTPPTPYPDKSNFNIGDSWEISFIDTNGDGSLDVFGGDLDGELVYLGDIMVLEDDGSGSKVFVNHGRTYVLPESKQLLNWYLDEKLDILLPNITEKTSSIFPPRIFEYLKPHQIISIKSYYRQPVYCDFDFRVNLIQSNISAQQHTIRKNVFEVMNNFFLYNLEKFEEQFFLTNIVTAIEEYISSVDGFNIDFETSLVLHRVMYDYKSREFDQNQKIIFIPLAFPFERIYDVSTGNLITTYLPQISGNGYDLFVDFDAFWTGDGTGTPNINSDVIGCPIHHGTDNSGPIVGYYFIRNAHQLDIEIQLFFSSDGTVISEPNPNIYDYIDLTVHPLAANIIEDDFFTDSKYGYLKLVYPGIDSTSWTSIVNGKNIPFTKYTIPRLKSVKFIEGL